MTASLLARPHMLALPIAAAWSAGLLAARDRGRAPPLALAALMTLWANMHGGFIFGLMLIGPFALEALAEAPAGARLATARAWTLFGLAALAAALINPYGVEALILPFRLMGIENLSRISEWRPQDFSHPGTMELALLMLIGLTLTRPFAMPPIRAALLVALVAMALQHSRHQALLAHPGADAAGEADRSGDRRRFVPRRAAAGCGDRDRGHGRGRAHCRGRAVHGADRAHRRELGADLGPRSGPAGTQGEAGAQRIRLRRLSDLLARAAVHRRPRRTLRRRDAGPLRQDPGGRPRRRWRARSSATASRGRSSRPTPGSSPSSTARRAGGGSIRTRPRSSRRARMRRRRASEGIEGAAGARLCAGRCRGIDPGVWRPLSTQTYCFYPKKVAEIFRLVDSPPS